MEMYTSGDTTTSEIFIDFKKKNTKIIDPVKGIEKKGGRFRILINPFIFISFFAIIIITSKFVEHDLILMFSIILIHWLVGVVFPKYKDFCSWLDQKIFNDTGTKKFMIVEKIKGKTWQLPYEFQNVKFDVNFYGDFAKYRSKLHLRPKDYYFKTGKEIKKQTIEWEAEISFTRHPVEGKMEVEWK